MTDDASSGTPPDRPRVALVILDGWGLREPADDNAVTLASTPSWDSIWRSGRFPTGRLTTHGPAVGLPEGQMGNSEVGHLNLGAGRVVPQAIQRITRAIETGEFFENSALTELLRQVRDRDGTLHLLGLIGPGGVHAVDKHLLALCDLAGKHGMPRTRVHAFLDGRDTPPQSARDYLTELTGRIGGAEQDHGGCELASVCGRYWAMDRDRRWERTARAYAALVHGEGLPIQDPVAAVADAYVSGESDEFIEPRVVVDGTGEAVGRIRDGDGVVFFNFRADRVRQLSRALMDPAFDGFDRGGPPPRVDLVTMTQYDEDLPLTTAFPPQELRNTLAEVLDANGLTSYRTAETEKYPHVTYFFNGGIEDAPAGEVRHMVPSPKVPTYDQQPEMSAAAVTDALLSALDAGEQDLYVCNYANPDMVGHTGILEAAVAAVETVDQQLGRVLEVCRRTGTYVVVTADHGNCEQMWDPSTNGPHTAHTLNQVGIVLVGPQTDRMAHLADGALCDVAPTILGLLGVSQPSEMTGRDLRVRAT